MRMSEANLSNAMRDPDRYARYARYARMRASAPVHFNSQLGVWEIYGYHDIQAVLGDPATFSSDLSAKPMLVFMDPPRHTQLRGHSRASWSRTWRPASKS